MQEITCGSSPDCKPQKAKKRLQYKRMSEDKKRDLIFRVMYLNENVRTVCYELGFNFSTGRNLVQRYKKTGEYVTQEKSQSNISNDYQKTGSSKGSEPKEKRCSIGLILLSDDKLQVVTSRVYAPQEEQALMQFHAELVKMRIV